MLFSPLILVIFLCRLKFAKQCGCYDSQLLVREMFVCILYTNYTETFKYN